MIGSITQLKEFWYTTPKDWLFENCELVYPCKFWFYKDQDPTLEEHQWRLAYNNELGWNHCVFDVNDLFDDEEVCLKICNSINGIKINA